MWNAELCSKSFSTVVLIYGVLKLFVLYEYFVIAKVRCPVDTSAEQKHRPSRQARPPKGAWQSVFF